MQGATLNTFLSSSRMVMDLGAPAQAQPNGLLGRTFHQENNCAGEQPGADSKPELTPPWCRVEPALSLLLG